MFQFPNLVRPVSRSCTNAGLTISESTWIEKSRGSAQRRPRRWNRPPDGTCVPSLPFAIALITEIWVFCLWKNMMKICTPSILLIRLERFIFGTNLPFLKGEGKFPRFLTEIRICRWGHHLLQGVEIIHTILSLNLDTKICANVSEQE